MGTTPDLGIPELSQSQANPDITHNEALVLIQAMLNGVKSRTLTTPPVSPTEGDSYIVGDGSPAASGAWAGKENAIAIYWGGSWRFVPGRDDDGALIAMGIRQEGIRIWVRDEEALLVWTGSPLSWSEVIASDAPVYLNAATTFYVNHSGGSNANDGLTIATAFATTAYALDYIYDRYNFNGQPVVLEERYAGDISERFIFMHQFRGQTMQNYLDSGFTYRGQTGTRIISTVGGNLSIIAGACNIETLILESSNVAVTQQSMKIAQGALCFAGGITFQGAKVGHMQSANGILYWYGTNQVTHGSGYLAVCETHGELHFGAAVFNFPNPITFTLATLNTTDGSCIDIDLVTWTNGANVTGVKWLETGGGINPHSLANNVPGTIAGRRIESFTEMDTRPNMTLGFDVRADFGTSNTPTTAPVVHENSNAGAVGAGLVTYHNSASPAASDVGGWWRAYGRDSAANVQLYGTIEHVISDPTSASEDSFWNFSGCVAGTFADRMRIGGGVYHPSATGTDKGDNTLNFGTIYENNDRVASYAKQNVFTDLNTFIRSVSVTAADITTSAFVIRSDDAGISGPMVSVYHNSTSPAIGDVACRENKWINDSGGTVVRLTQIASVADAVTAGAHSGRYSFATIRAGGLASRFEIGAGLYHTAAVGGDQGNNTINYSAVYDDGVLLCAPLNPDMTIEEWDDLVPNRLHPAFIEPEAVPTGEVIPAVFETRKRPTGERGPNKFVKVRTKGGDELELEVPGDPIYEEYEVEVQPERQVMTERMVTITPEHLEVRKHRTAKRYFDMLAEGFNPNEATEYVKRMRADRAVPGLMTLDEFKRRYHDPEKGCVDKQSAHERAERLQLAMDYLAVAFGDVVDRLAATEARLTALEALNGSTPVDKTRKPH